MPLPGVASNKNLLRQGVHAGGKNIRQSAEHVNVRLRLRCSWVAPRASIVPNDSRPEGCKTIAVSSEPLPGYYLQSSYSSQDRQGAWPPHPEPQLLRVDEVIE